MPAYRPFLLPLLDCSSESFSEAKLTTALEEEAIINGLSPASRPTWEVIADRARKSYGLRFLLENDPPVNRQVLNFHSKDGSCISTLTGTIMKTAYFMMSHPDDLPLFDSQCTEGFEPALVKPSLFSLWINGQSSPRALKKIDSPALDKDPVAALHDYLGKLTEANRPSDWHLEPGRDCYSSRLRIFGQLTEAERISRKKGDWIIQSVISQCGLSASPIGQLLEGSFPFSQPGRDPMEARVSLIPSRNGYALVVRFLYPEGSAKTLTGLGMSSHDSDRLTAAFSAGEGLWLVAGPTGSGKSTTLLTLLRWCVRDNEKILTIEDPVEQILDGVQQVQVDRDRGLDFAQAVRAFLRQSPNTILIGEIRDVETASIAMQSARTGHRVLSSLHARNTSGVIRRIQDLEQDEWDLNAVCDMLIHQRLLPLVCSACGFHHEAEPELFQLAHSLHLERPERTVLGIGCAHCRSGYTSRTGIFSVGSIQEQPNSDRRLLEAAWAHFVRGKTDLRAVLPYFPSNLRQQFTLCQV